MEGMAGATIGPDALTLPLVVAAALADSVNPCAFAVLLTFIAATFVLAERASATGATGATGAAAGLPTRWFLYRTGSVYVAGVFLTYLSLGLGLLAFGRALGQTHWVSRAAGLGAIVLGLVALQEALVPEWGVRLTVPARLRGWLRRLTEKATLPAALGAGVLVGLCTVPCSGAVYLAVLGLLATRTTWTAGLGYLVLYNALFVAPLVVLLALAGSKPVFYKLSYWQLHNRGALKLTVALAAVFLGVALLAIV
jgi:cytochrome c-type biogenesis protein